MGCVPEPSTALNNFAPRFGAALPTRQLGQNLRPFPISDDVGIDTEKRMEVLQFRHGTPEDLRPKIHCLTTDNQGQISRMENLSEIRGTATIGHNPASSRSAQGPAGEGKSSSAG